MSGFELPANALKAIERLSRDDCHVHSVLLYGSKGAGKQTLARMLAKNWLSNNDPESPQAKSFDNDRNADFLLVTPTGPSRLIKEPQLSPPKGRGAPEFQGISVLEFVRTPPLVSARKVVLIEDSERMAVGASNLLLKSLEEPYDYVKFILTTSRIGAIRPTVRSRCLAVSCATPVTGEDPIALLAEGAPGRIQELTKVEESCRHLWSFAGSLRSRPRIEALLASEELKSIADSLQKGLDLNARSANAEALELLATACRSLEPEWQSARAQMIEAHRRVLGNGQAGIVLDAMFTRIFA